jgi:hypothetical protein
MTGILSAGALRRYSVLLGSAALCLSVSPAMAGNKEQSYVLTYAGLLDVIGGDTRVYAGGMADVYMDRGIGLHADVVTVDREEDATYFGGGISFAVNDHFRPKFMIGTSTSNRAVLPDLFLQGSVRIKPGDNSGWVITPGVTYRHFRDGQHETVGSVQIAKYFSAPFDTNGYYVAQLGAETTIEATNPARVAFNGGISTVRKSGVIFGVTGEAGTLFRDPIATAAFRGRFFAIRPNLEVPLFDRFSLTTRGEYVDTQLYNALGGSAGVKVKF